jgi:hypothetical protein
MAKQHRKLSGDIRFKGFFENLLKCPIICFAPDKTGTLVFLEISLSERGKERERGGE